MKTTVDAFGTEVIVGDTVVFMASNRKTFETGKVVKCTKHGATVSCDRVPPKLTQVNVRSERIYRVPVTAMSDEDVQKMVKETLDEAWGNNQ